MGFKYKCYEDSLQELKLQKLSESRRNICLTYAKRTILKAKVSVATYFTVILATTENWDLGFGTKELFFFKLFY